MNRRSLLQCCVKDVSRSWLLPILLCLLYLCFSLPRLSQLSGLDEILYAMRLGRMLSEEGFRHGSELIAYSPHLYALCIALSHRVFGSGAVAARLPGVLGWIGALGLVWLWLHRRREGLTGAVALALAVTMPLVVQGGGIADIDNGFLGPLVFLQCWSVDRFVERRDRRGAFLVILATALALWGRLTTPAILLPVFVIYAWAKAGRRTRFCLAGWLTLGCLLFGASWGCYCRLTGVSFADPFVYLWDSLLFSTVGSRGASLRKVLFTGVYLWFWMGGGFLALVLLACARRLREWWRQREWRREDLFLGAGLFLLLGYSVVGGTLFGFPKYHCPAVPLLLVGCSPLLAETRGKKVAPAWGWLVGLAVFSFAIQCVVIGDPILLLRVDLRQAMVSAPSLVHPLLQRVAGCLLLGGLLVLIPFLLAWWRRLCPVSLLLAVTLGMNAGLLARQGIGGYQTGYNYGDQGDTRAVAEWLDSRMMPDALAMVPGEVVYLLERPGLPYLENDQWRCVSGMVKALRSPRMAAVGVSILTNDVEQYRAITANVKIRAVLDKEYTEHQIGNYVLFLRKRRQ